MAKRYLIDSNIVIGYLDNKLPSSGMNIVNIAVDAIPNISVITQIEVLRFNAPDHIYKVLEDFINESNILELNSAVISNTITICKSYRIKLPDAIIAATAISHDLILMTRNVADFKRIDGLKLINPWEVK